MIFDEWWGSPQGWKPCDGARSISYRAFQAGAASRDAEIQRLQMALADTEALEIGTAEKCGQLREQVAVLREAFQTFIDEHEECIDDDDWLAMMCSYEAYHVANEALADTESKP